MGNHSEKLSKDIGNCELEITESFSKLWAMISIFSALFIGKRSMRK
jgi:hypothetical protein